MSMRSLILFIGIISCSAVMAAEQTAPSISVGHILADNGQALSVKISRKFGRMQLVNDLRDAAEFKFVSIGRDGQYKIQLQGTDQCLFRFYDRKKPWARLALRDCENQRARKKELFFGIWTFSSTDSENTFYIHNVGTPETCLDHWLPADGEPGVGLYNCHHLNSELTPDQYANQAFRLYVTPQSIIQH